MDLAGAARSLFWFSHSPRLSMYGWIWVTVVWAIACVDVMAGKLEMALFWALTRPWRDQATRGTLKAVFCGTRYDLDEYDKYIKFKYAWRSN